MSIIIDDSFKGEYDLPIDCFSQLSYYIDKYEKEYLLKLLGAELYDLFIADLTVTDPQVPQATRFLNIFNQFHIDEGNCLVTSDGIKQMLVQLVYFHILRDLEHKKTMTGVVQMVGANSVLSSYNGYNLIEAYNRGVSNFKSIQWYICDNPTDYPEDNGQFLDYISGI